MKIYYLVKGLVQGVGYRNFVKQTADQLGVVGWVRNLNTHDVELLAFTDAQTHNKLFEALSKGPSKAKVEKVLQKEVSVNDTELDGFKVLETREKPCHDL